MSTEETFLKKWRGEIIGICIGIIINWLIKDL